jgi:hypothetical protein
MIFGNDAVSSYGIGVAANMVKNKHN